MEADVVVIGGGPAGYVAAIRLGQLKKKVLLVEKDELGGECLNYGCIPTKALIEVANRFWHAKGLSAYGLDAKDVAFDMRAFQEKRGSFLGRLRDGIAYLLKGNGVKVVKGFAEVSGSDEVTVSGGDGIQRIRTGSILWAVGSEHVELREVPYDGKHVLSPRDFLGIDRVLRSITIIGGGAVGLEVATALRKLGSRVYVIEIMEQVLPGFSPDIANILQRSLRRMGVEVFTGSRATSVIKEDGRVSLEVLRGKESLRIESEFVLVSVGKKPSEQNKKLVDLGVELDGKGYVKVDGNMRTSVENIFAAGDATGPPLLAHKAYRQGLVAAESIEGLDLKRPTQPIPIAIFTDPEVATVGMFEEEARSSGYDASAARFPLSALGRAVASDAAEGFVKVVYDKRSGRLLGLQVVGPHASELIGIAALALVKGMRVEDLESVMYPHPTFSEAIGEAASLSLIRPIHMLKR